MGCPPPAFPARPPRLAVGHDARSPRLLAVGHGQAAAGAIGRRRGVLRLLRLPAALAADLATQQLQALLGRLEPAVQVVVGSLKLSHLSLQASAA